MKKTTLQEIIRMDNTEDKITGWFTYANLNSNFYAVRTILSEYAESKTELYDVLKKSPYWVQNEMRLAIPCNFSIPFYPKDFDYEITSIMYELSYIIDNPKYYAILDSYNACAKTNKMTAECYDLLKNAGFKTNKNRPFNRSFANLIEQCLSSENIPTYANIERIKRCSDKLVEAMGSNPQYNDVLYISINPMDYITMSVGNSWASCHCVRPDYIGCYSAGTISYMLDKVTAIAYTESKETENGIHMKKNRFCVHFGYDGFILSRGYGDYKESYKIEYSKHICKALNLSIREFYTGEDSSDYRVLFTHHSDGSQYKDYYHYPDEIDFVMCYNVILEPIYSQNSANDISYRRTIGEQAICILCGDNNDNESNLQCYSCNNDLVCEECGERIGENDVIWVDGTPYCHDCATFCDECGDAVLRRNTYDMNVYTVCSWCSDNCFTECDECGEIYHDDDIHFDHVTDRYLCDYCWAHRHDDDDDDDDTEQ